MATEGKADRVLNHIIIYGFSFSFGAVLASLQALRPRPNGFALEVSWWTLVAFVLGGALVAPCFHLMIYSRRQRVRCGSLAAIVVLGVGSFFYPMRMVPREKMFSVFTGLAAAVIVLSIIAGLLLLLHRFFEQEQKRGDH